MTRSYKIFYQVNIFFGLLSFVTPLLSQFHIARPQEYYDKFYFGKRNIYTYNEDCQSFRVDTSLLYNKYLTLEILGVQRNTKYLRQDVEGVYLPYDYHYVERAQGLPSFKYYDTDENREYKKDLTQQLVLKKDNFISLDVYSVLDEFDEVIKSNSHNHEVFRIRRAMENGTEYEGLLEYSIDRIPIELLDTIYIMRNPPTDYEKLTDDMSVCEKSRYYEVIKFITLDQSIESSKRYNHLMIEASIEMEECDLYSINEPFMREVVNPHAITNKIIKKLSYSLQDFGYLSYNATSYEPDIKNAIIELQLDHNLPTGFLDQETLAILGLEFKKSYCKCVKNQVVCLPPDVSKVYRRN